MDEVAERAEQAAQLYASAVIKKEHVDMTSCEEEVSELEAYRMNLEALLVSSRKGIFGTVVKNSQ